MAAKISATGAQTQEAEDEDSNFYEEILEFEEDADEEEDIPVVPEPEPKTVPRGVALTRLLPARESSSQQKAVEPLPIFKYTDEPAPIEPPPETIAESISESSPLFNSLADLRRAVILKEILDKPKGLRGFQDNDW